MGLMPQDENACSIVLLGEPEVNPGKSRVFWALKELDKG
jgi:hypothetical protein